MSKDNLEKNKTIKELIELAKEKPYYGLRYGYFSWVRGQIDIHDVDDINYILKCLDKIKRRIRYGNK